MPNRKVLIETPTDTVASSGQVTKVWATYRAVWCARMYNKGFDVERSDRFEVATNYKYKFTGWDSSITTSMRINDGGRYYYIHNIEPLGVGANMVEVDCRLTDHIYFIDTVLCGLYPETKYCQHNRHIDSE